MNTLVEQWNREHSKIPKNKSVSRYAILVEKQFPEHSMVCDLGGGTGADALYFLQRGHNVILLDISDYALKVASQKAKDLKLDIKTKRVTLGEERIPLGSSSVDVVYSRLALHYFDWLSTVQIFKEIKRILRKGGKAFITLKSPDDKEEMKFLCRTAIKKEKGVYVDDGKIKSRFTIQNLKTILKEAGVEGATIEKYEEDLSGRVDKVKSGISNLLLNEIRISN